MRNLVQILSMISLYAEIKKHNSTYVCYGFMPQFENLVFSVTLKLSKDNLHGTNLM